MNFGSCLCFTIFDNNALTKVALRQNKTNMQPFKYGQTIALWLLRISLVLYLFLNNLNRLNPIDFQSIRFYIAVALIVFSVLLLIGGLLSKPSLTIISGLIVFLVSGYQLAVSFNGRLDISYVLILFPLSIGFFFFCYGNK